MQWEEILSHDIGVRWHAWITSLPPIKHSHPSLDGNKNGHDTLIHVFCDASERAYGSVLYARSTAREGIIVRLAYSKNGLAPVKK